MKMSGSDTLREGVKPSSPLRNALLGSALCRCFSPGEFYLKLKPRWFAGSRTVCPRCSPHQVMATRGVHSSGVAEGPFVLKETSRTFIPAVTSNNYQRDLYHRERKNWCWLTLSLYATQVGAQAKVMTIITFCCSVPLFLWSVSLLRVWTWLLLPKHSLKQMASRRPELAPLLSVVSYQSDSVKF